MAKYAVDIPARMTHRKMTVNQFIAEFGTRAKGERDTGIYTLPHPVKMIIVHADRTATVEKFTLSLPLFRRITELYRSKSVICCLSTKEWSLGAYDIFTLNQAIQTAALKRGGHNIITNFLHTRKSGQTALRGDLQQLFSFLEIRPVSITPKPVAPKPRHAIYYVYNGIRHNVIRLLDGKIRPNEKTKASLQAL